MSINLNNSTYGLLNSNSGLTAIIQGKIFPLIIPENTSLPAIVIERNFTGNYTNDGQNWYDSTLTITILSVTYNEGVTIATLVDNILDNYRSEASGNHIMDCHLESCDEGYQEDAFVQKLIYSVKDY